MLSISWLRCRPAPTLMWAKVEEHYNKNVWHQLTIQLQLIPIYQEFIMEFEATVVLDRFTSSEEAIVFLRENWREGEYEQRGQVLVSRVKLHKYEQHKENKVVSRFHKAIM